MPRSGDEEHSARRHAEFLGRTPRGRVLVPHGSRFADPGRGTRGRAPERHSLCGMNIKAMRVVKCDG